LCICNCGNEKIVSSNSLRTKGTQSCGGLRLKWCSTGKARKTHGLFVVGKGTSKVYQMWANMLQRCYNEKVQGYKNYGGRSIKVHLPWHKFEYFLEDLKKLNMYDLATTKGYSIDRINNNEDYWPKNIKMSTNKEQQNNKRKRKKV
jgi:hypothetical protein